MPVDKFGRMSDTKTKDTGVSLTYINNNYVRSDGGTPISGSLDMRFNKLVNLHKPTEQYDAATKDYVDYVEKEIREKLEKEIREKLEKKIREKLEKRTHLIAVHARYCGPLKEGEYPFKFGGNSLEICDETFKKEYKLNSIISGFVMPHSGRIKKIICEGVTFIKMSEIADKVINLLKEEQINELKKYFRKEDFKKDLQKKILLHVDFFMHNYETKKIFEIIKIEKDFDARRFFRSLLNLFVVVEKFDHIEREDSRRTEIIAIMKVLNHDIIPLKEGETINIRVLDFQKGISSEGNLIRNILQESVLRLISSLNFNFTFLIELDPL